MNRQAYLAELAQLLYYMTAWDRDAALAKYTKLFEERDNDFAVIQELGSPMKLAVTLSRSYEASPEPAEDAAELESPAPAEETPAEVPEAVSAEETTEPAQTTEEPPEPTKDESTESPAAEESAETVSEPETQPEQPVEETPAETTAQPEVTPDAPVQPEPVKRTQVREVRDEIFSEIFEAATQAQSAVVVPEKDESPIVRKSRPGFLILYALLCIVVGIPVTVFLLAVDLVIFCLAVASFGVGIYVVLFLVDPRFSILGDKLVIIGITILCFTVAVAICSLAVWFLRNAVVAFIRMLVRFGRKHGYKEEDCP